MDMNNTTNGKEIYVVSLADNNYAQHLGVTFASMLTNLSPGSIVKLYVMTTGLTEKNRTRLTNTVTRLGGDIQIIEVDGSPYEQFNTTGHLNRETYLRLAISEVLPSSVEKAILLDSDVVVTGNIAEMWQTDLKGHVIAAVAGKGTSYRCKELGIPEGVYFNAGIFVVNLLKWREESISSKIRDYIAHNPNLEYLDQDAMNALLYDDWLELPSKWNVLTYMLESREWEDPNPPAIIHYTGSSKPWHFDNIHPYKNEYYKYLRMTEWKVYKPEFKFSLFLKRIVRHVQLFFLRSKLLLKKLLPKPAVTLLVKFKSYMT
jgi:lipopolysaccharide biosynthesis glycosyltransferase